MFILIMKDVRSAYALDFSMHQ